MRPAALSVSSDSSISSTSSSRVRKSYASPRRSILSNASPPLSPGLPSLLSRHGRSTISGLNAPSNRWTWWQLLFMTLTSCFSVYVILRSFVSYCNQINEHSSYDLVDQLHLPEDPSALIVHDDRGKQKWTVWIPPQAPFPLRPLEYAEICAQATEIQYGLGSGSGIFNGKHKYYAADPYFVDITEALSKGLLPATSESLLDGSLDRKSTCKRSLTFVMETDDVSMGNSLLALWLAYGLARKESRAFFVEDSRWAYGNYSTYFQPPPDPGCRPPPPNYRLPCPRSTDHLVISHATFSHVYGSSFLAEHIDNSKPKAPSSEQQHRIYDLIRDGYEALFRLADKEDAEYVRQRTTDSPFKPAKDGGGMIVGVHIRRGDAHPWQPEFQGDYLPLSRYMDEARHILLSTYDDQDHHSSTHSHSHSKAPSSPPSSSFDLLRKRQGAAAIHASRILLASDDPLVYAAPETRPVAARAQAHIVLASKQALESLTAGSSHVVRGPLDTMHGWEGGFFRDVFLALGLAEVRHTRMPPGRPVLRGKNTRSVEYERFVEALMRDHPHHHGAASAGAGAGASPGGGWARQRHVEPHHQAQLLAPGPETLALRAVVGRSYLLDLAVLGQADAVVCAVSSAACRVLAVMMGWEAITEGRWRNVDGNFGWQGLVVK